MNGPLFSVEVILCERKMRRARQRVCTALSRACTYIEGRYTPQSLSDLSEVTSLPRNLQDDWSNLQRVTFPHSWEPLSKTRGSAGLRRSGAQSIRRARDAPRRPSVIGCSTTLVFMVFNHQLILLAFNCRISLSRSTR